MSVIVKGMEMPEHCYDCPLQDGETGRCNILGITVYDIPKECPLIELVRCKDCKYGHELLDEHGNIDIYRLCKGKERTADWFCADGERREDAEIH